MTAIWAISHKVALKMKRCPNCKSEVIDWHSFCQDCHTHIPSFAVPERPVSTYRGKVDRSWTTWLLIGGFVAGSSLIVGTMDWRGLSQLLRGQTMTAEEVARVNESVREKLARRRVSRGRVGAATGAEISATDTLVTAGTSVESASTPPALQPSIQPVAVERETPAATFASYGTKATPESAPDVEIQQVEASPTDRSGIVSINCQVPARIYINGQFSGTTPRAIHLNAGEYQIRLVAEGYLEWNSKVRVRDREQRGVLASLTRAE